jgi:hypothetical protein
MRMHSSGNGAERSFLQVPVLFTLVTTAPCTQETNAFVCQGFGPGTARISGTVESRFTARHTQPYSYCRLLVRACSVQVGGRCSLVLRTSAALARARPVARSGCSWIRPRIDLDFPGPPVFAYSDRVHPERIACLHPAARSGARCQRMADSPRCSACAHCWGRCRRCRLAALRHVPAD